MSSLGLIKESFNRLKGKWIPVIFSTFIISGLISFLINMLGYGSLIAVSLIGFVIIGEITFIRNVINDKPYQLEELFKNYKAFLPAFLTTIILIVGVSVGLVLLLVPGILILLNYSFALHTLEEDIKIGSLEALKRSKDLSMGNHTKIMSFYLWFFLIVAVIFGLSVAICLIPYFLLGWSLLITAAILSSIIVGVLLAPLFYSSITLLYDNLKNGEQEVEFNAEQEETEEELF